MSDDNGLSPPGTGTYSSNTLHVGDGTWDNGRDTFLLPNLVGLNFETMQYNGMGNRFKDLPEYHRLIAGHGVLAAITFLGVIPAAIYFVKYGFWNRPQALKLHVYLQILALILATIVLILGWFAVGPERSLTNPHHGIGVAIYTLLWVQLLYGWLMARIEKNRKNVMTMTRIPTKVWIHKLLGRTIALVGIVQIPLGLTLYGSPKILFILYSLWAFVLLIGYLVLDRYYFEKMPLDRAGGNGSYYSYNDSYVSGTQLTGDPPRRQDANRTHWGRDVLGAVGALGAYEAFQHRRMRKREEREQSELDAERRHQRPSAPSYGPSSGPPLTPGGPNRPPNERPLSPESWEDEKIGQDSGKHTWRDRLLGAGVGIAAFEGARRLFGRKRRDDDYDAASYRPPLGGNHSFVSQTDVSRVQQGQAPFSPGTPGGGLGQDRPHGNMPAPMTPSRPPRRPRPSADSLSYADDDDSLATPGPRPQEESHTLRDSIAVLGVAAGIREWNKNRKLRRARARDDQIRRQELENEDRFNRRTSGNYPGPQHVNRRPSMSETIMTGTSGQRPQGEPGITGSNAEMSRYNQRPLNGRPGMQGPDTMHPPLPAAAGAVAPSPLRGHTPVQPQGYQLPPPPPGPPPNAGRPIDYRPPEPGSLQMPSGAVNPDPSRLMNNPAADAAAAGLIGAGAAAALGRGNRTDSPSRYNARPDSRSRIQGGDGQGGLPPPGVPSAGPASAGSPPVSLKMKVHNDGKHVTLRRLNEEEAAAERAARRQDKRQRRRRGSSLSSGDEPSGSSQRYRRNNGPILPSIDQPITNVPPPPPMSSSAGASGRPPSELNLPPVPPVTAGPSRIPGQSNTPPSQRPSPAAPPHGAAPVGSMMSGGFGSPGDAGTGTDVSAFADNRRRRRAERARRLEAARGTNRVEFE